MTKSLLPMLRALRADVAAEGAATYRSWRPSIARPGFAASALNMAHYIALRHRDLRPVQQVLARHGLSSLGRLEGRVLTTLDAVGDALSGASGEAPADPRRWPPPERRFFRGETTLRANAATLFGAAPKGREVRILITLGTDAATDPAVLVRLARAGANAVRINCAHDTADVWAAMIAHTRAAAAATGRPLRVLMDIAGPKLRTGDVRHPEDESRLHPNDRLLLVPDPADLTRPSDFGFRAVCEPGAVLRHLCVGAEVAYDDGRIGGEVAALHIDGSVEVRVLRAKIGGVKLRPEKGLNFPGTVLDLDPLTPKDLADLDFVAAHADLIGYSFVQSGADVARLQAELAARRPDDWATIGLIAKIETLRAVQNLPDIVVRAAGHQPFGVMIARGDLAVEIGFARLAEMQEEILWLCEAGHIPVLWATQVLEEMVKSGLPTRGEMTDAAMSARAECVMLNKGPNVTDAVVALDALLRRMAEHQNKKTARMRVLHAW